jgi:hypothetical protein
VLRPSSEDRLDSWKEIAAHLKRSVRTSRCWEAEEDLLELRRQMQSRDSQIALDLEDVTLVDASAVGFLADCESEGVTLQRGSPYVLAWIDREREGNGSVATANRRDDIRRFQEGGWHAWFAECPGG